MILGVPSAVEQDVGRLQVAVDDPRAGGPRATARASVSTSRGRPRRGLGRAVEPLGQAAARRRTPARRTAGRRARRRRRSGTMLGCWSRATASASARKRAAARAPAWRAGQDHLQGDEPVQPRLPGLVDDAHAAAAELLQDLVIATRGSLGSGLGGISSAGTPAAVESERVGISDTKAPGIGSSPPAWGADAGTAPATPPETAAARCRCAGCSSTWISSRIASSFSASRG